MTLVMLLCLLLILWTTTVDAEQTALRLKDFAYLYKLGFASGVGADIISYRDGLLTLRGLALWSIDSKVKDRNNVVVGAGIMFDMSKAITKNNKRWKTYPITFRFGTLIGYDLEKQRTDWGLVIQMIRIEF